MAQFATPQHVLALFPTVGANKDAATLIQLITLASGEAERICHRRLALTHHVEMTVVESGAMGTGRAVGGLGFAAVRTDLPFYQSWSPTTVFLRDFPVAELSKLSIIYPSGGQGDIALNGVLLNGDEGWFQLPMGVYCPERSVAQATYWSGYPQTTIAVAALAGDLTLQVAEARGIVIGSRLQVYQFTSDEDIQILAQPVPGNGPSTLSLSGALLYDHPVGTPVWGTPEVLTTATCYLVADYLTTGSWPTNVPGGVAMVKSGDITMTMRGAANSKTTGIRGPLAEAATDLLVRGGLVRTGM